MSDSRLNLRPEKFNGKDWMFWKQQMKCVFMLDGLWSIVNGEERKPQEELQQSLKQMS
jgi:hypothetical protein